MIDFIPFSIKQDGLVEKLKSELNFTSCLTKNNNLVWSALYKKMKIKIFEPSMEIHVAGSLHYLKNEGLHNWNDFTRLELFDTIIGFCNRFGIDPKNAKLRGVEFGVNIKVPFEPSYFIKRVLAYKKGKIEQLTAKAEKSDAIKICFDQYRLKIYNKSKQFGTDSNILRFEVKISRMAKVWGMTELKTLHDLLKPEILQKLGRILLSEFNELIVSEPMQTERMTIRERATFERMNNREFWELITNKSNRRNAKSNFKKLKEKYGTGLHKTTSILISEKWNELLQCQYVEQRTNLAPFNRVKIMLKNENKDEMQATL